MEFTSSNIAIGVGHFGNKRQARLWQKKGFKKFDWIPPGAVATKRFTAVALATVL